MIDLEAPSMNAFDHVIRKSCITLDSISHGTGETNIRIVGAENLRASRGLYLTCAKVIGLPFRLRVGKQAIFDVSGLRPATIAVRNEELPEQKLDATLDPVVRARIGSVVFVGLPPKELEDPK